MIKLFLKNNKKINSQHCFITERIVVPNQKLSSETKWALKLKKWSFMNILLDILCPPITVVWWKSFRNCETREFLRTCTFSHFWDFPTQLLHLKGRKPCCLPEHLVLQEFSCSVLRSLWPYFRRVEWPTSRECSGSHGVFSQHSALSSALTVSPGAQPSGHVPSFLVCSGCSGSLAFPHKL